MTTTDRRHHVLITGGSQGIGLGLAARFIEHGSTVLITGRDPQRLNDAAARHPGLRTLVNDIARPDDRQALATHVKATMPQLDMLINNAGIQRRIALAADDSEWYDRQTEIDILLSAPVHLNHLLIPVLLADHKPATIINVTSGGALVPQPFAPLYSACKAALHSYTVNLRFAVAKTPCSVVELIPPAVATGLAGTQPAHGADLDAFCDAVFPELLRTDRETIGYGTTDTPQIRQLLNDTTALFDELAGRFPVTTY